MTNTASTIVPVILSGGAGTRLWPMSTPDQPKQFLPLTSEQTMFQLTLARTRGLEAFGNPIIVANARHGDLIDAQLAAMTVTPAAVILEPAARNSAPAIALAAAFAPESVLLIMPSDHVIADADAFRAAILRGLPFAQQGWLVTFGIAPDGPETGYGYIRSGEALDDGVSAVDRFIEKPDRDRARAMLAEGGHYWNGGIFLMAASALLAALDVHAPAIRDAVTDALNGAQRDGAHVHPDRSAFEACPSDSIDYAVMEKADRVAVVPVSMGWSDIGSWDALHTLAAKDDDGNAVTGPARLVGAQNCLIQSDGVRISCVGVEDLIIVASGNEVMILPRGQSQEAKRFSK